jgi:hypothetical protein
MARARVALVSALALWGVACSLLEPLDGLTGGHADGGVDARSDATVDAGVDAPGTIDGAAGDHAADAADASAQATDAADAADAMGSDAPPEAAPVPEAGPGPEGGPGSCADAGVLLCEDFENGLDVVKWPDISTTNAATVVDTTLAHRGAHSLHTTAFAVAADAGSINIQGGIGHPVAVPSPVYVRAFYWFSSPLPPVSEAFAVAVQTHPPWLGLQLEVANGGVYAMTDWAVSPNMNVNGTQPAAVGGGWRCIEWEITQEPGDAGVGSMSAWLEGQPIGGLELASIPMSDLGELTFGIGFYLAQQQPQYEVWVDDVFVDTAPVGCSK